MLPIWSAAVDPCVLVVRAVEASGPSAHFFGADKTCVRIVRGLAGEHVLVLRDGAPVRLDVIAGTIAGEPVILHFDVIADDRLPHQLETIRSFGDRISRSHRHKRASRGLLALHALDAHTAGASLRETADAVLGPGDWPGDGEHRKSLVRRLLKVGDRMILAGPRAVLNQDLIVSTGDHG